MAAAMARDAPGRVLTVEDLHTQFMTQRGPAMAVDGVSLHIDRGEVLGVVGESGCGKSVTALSIMGLIEAPGQIVSGRIAFAGQDLRALAEPELRKLRGNRIAMIFQDPTVTLNPVLRIGDQITEVLRFHAGLRGVAARSRAVELLEMVGIPAPASRLGQYPHQFSGGMQQRVVIAIALAMRPQLLLADEPTTALDVTVQAEILDLLKRLQEESGTATMLITHDIGVVAQTCHRVVVMYGGKVVESGTVADILESPQHPYTAGLIGAVPQLDGRPGERLHSIPGIVPDLVQPPRGCRFHPRCAFVMDICRQIAPPPREVVPGHAVACHLAAQTRDSVAPLRLMPREAIHADGAVAADQNGHTPDAAREALLDVRDLVKEFPAGWDWDGRRPHRRTVRAVDGVSFHIAKGEAFGLVGESGCGKSTTARLIMRLMEPTAGEVRLDGSDLVRLPPAALFDRRRFFQMVFQNPYASLDPRWPVERLVGEPLTTYEGKRGRALREPVLGLLSAVSLGSTHLQRYPHQLSGGQRQRVAIARALALNPSLLVADEPVSALDVSIQAQILNLLIELKERLGLSLLFISHNLAVIHHLCDRVGVMYVGQLVESGRVEQVMREPRHPYTQMLVSSIPEPRVNAGRSRIVAQGEVTPLHGHARNCPFHTRCPHAREICRTTPPRVVAVASGHTVRCHLVASGAI